MIVVKRRFNNDIRLLISISILLLFIVIISLLYNIKSLIEIDFDEGINLIKSHLVLNGYKLYTEIWSDQPPVFTLLLAGWIKIFGYEIFYLRILILIFSAVIIWCLFEIIRRIESVIAAVFSVFFIITSCFFIKFSISILIGLPAISFLMLSILFLTYYRIKGRTIFLILSGILFAVSIQTKFFTAFVLISIVTELIIFECAQANKKDIRKRCLKAILLYLIPLILTYSFIALYFKIDFSQLFDTHIKAEAIKYNNINLFSYILCDLDIYIFVIVTLIIAFTKKILHVILPISWFLLSMIIFGFHNPFWDHHYTLVLIPACWLASICTSRFMSKLMKKENKPKAFRAKASYAISVLIILGFLTTVIFIPIKVLKSRRWYAKTMNYSQQCRAINPIINKYKDVAHWSLFDRPIYLFYNRMLVPPELAVFSKKRITTQYLTIDNLVLIINKYKPGLINFNRFRDLNSKIIPYIKDDYILLGYDMMETNAPPDNYSDGIEDVDFSNQNTFYLFVSKKIQSNDLIN